MLKSQKYHLGTWSEFGARRRLSFEAQDWLIGRLAEEQEKGALYKVVAHLTGDFTDDQAEEISNMVSIKMRKKFNKMQVISMSRNTYDLLIYVDPNKYEDAQMVYGEFVESLEGLAKVRKQNITKKLIILEIQ